MTRASILVGLALALSLLGARGARPPDVPAVLHVEDVVRWHVAGVPESEIVARIQSSAVEFDLSDDMVEELRLAGVPSGVLTAMRARQVELHPATPPPSPKPTPAAASLVVRLHGPKADEPARLHVPTRVPPAIATRLAIEDPSPVVTGVALYAACVRATHVPSHWRSESPLGRDFATMPRHEMLQFLPLEAPDVAATKGAEKVLTVDVPPSIEVPLDPAETHDLDLGVAVRIGDRYYRMESDTWTAIALSEHADGVEVEIATGPSGMRVRFVRPG